MARRRTKRPRTKARVAKAARAFSVRALNRKTGKTIEIGEDRAYELFIGGLVGLWGMAAQMKLSDKTQAALFFALHEGIKAATPNALVKVYAALGGGPLPIPVPLPTRSRRRK